MESNRTNPLVRYLWASPATLVGLAVAFVALALGARAEFRDGTLEVGGGHFARVVGRLPSFMRFGAITFGHVIIGVNRAELERSRAHERIHVGQYERWGILLFPLYLASSLSEVLQGRPPYPGNRFEREARRLSGR